MMRRNKKTQPVAKADRFTPDNGWGAQFETAFDFVKNGQGNGAILAVAGGGKTTAIVEACMRIRDEHPYTANKSILVVAFNSSVRDTMAQKLAGWNVEVRTVHQHGFRALRSPAGWGGMKGNASFDIQRADGAHIMGLVESQIGPEKEKLNDCLQLCRLVSLCKTRLASKFSEVLEVINRFNIETTYPHEDFAQYAMNIIQQNEDRPGTTIERNFARGRKSFAKKAITFDDMVWLPVVKDWDVEQFDIVFIDEAQDLSPARTALIKKSVKPGGRIIAVGDPRQCVHEDTIVELSSGEYKNIRDILVGESILSYRKGKNTFATVESINDSEWTYGYEVTTKSGKKIHMTPTHKLWAKLPQLKDQHIVYLMWREDKGFRIGITNKTFSDKNAFGHRTGSERADKLWVLNIVNDREEALLIEESTSLEYGIPTCVFEGANRGLNQTRIDTLFSIHGQNGKKLLESRHMDFGLPHWSAQGIKKRCSINISAHGTKQCQVHLEWSNDPHMDSAFNGMYSTYHNDNRRIRKYTASYSKAIDIANELAKKASSVGINPIIKDTLYVPDGSKPRLINAASLCIGMLIPVKNKETVSMEEIVSIEQKNGRFIDINVADTRCFFGNDILTHNCIYSFAGADIDALPELMAEIEATPLPLSTTFRCAKNVVSEAQMLNPDIEATKNAPDGVVDYCEAKDILNKVGHGDVVLSRTNAPLVRLFFQLARKQARVKFIGKDYGTMLQMRINGWKNSWEVKVANGNASGYFTIEKLLEYNNRWLANKGKTEDGADKKIHDRFIDEHATVEALTMYLNNPIDSEEAVGEVLKRCSMFSPDEDAKNDSYITLSTAHRFKGLERNHAYVLIDTFDPGANLEEANLKYVAVTRAMNHLTYAKGKIGKA